MIEIAIAKLENGDVRFPAIINKNVSEYNNLVLDETGGAILFKDLSEATNYARHQGFRVPSIAYVAGKINGDPNYRIKFRRAQNKLEDMGYIVLNPAELPEGMGYNTYLPICISMLEAASIVYMLNDWENSKGAKTEHAYAVAQQKSIIYQSQKVEHNEYSTYVMRCVRQNLGLEADDESEDNEIYEMSKSEILNSVCTWNNLINYGDTIKSWVRQVYGVKLDE